MNAFSIRTAEPQDWSEWRDLWLAYNEFYETTLPEDVTQATWQRILDPASDINALVAVDEQKNKLLGFTNYVLHPYTWGKADLCYLEDLFTTPTARGQGVGRALIEQLLHLATDNGWDRVYWVTKEYNHQARALYDHFSKADGFVRYVVRAEPST